MTLSEALEIARSAKPLQRQPLDKLHGGNTAADIDLRITALAKRFDHIGGTVAQMQKRIDQAAADVEYVRDYQPGQPPRRMH